MADNHSDLVGKEFIFKYGVDRILPPSEKTGGVFATEQRAYRRERIVRCRDCRHGRKGEPFKCTLFFGIGDCLDVPVLAKVDPDGFCAWGEPREDGSAPDAPTDRQRRFIKSIQDALGIEFAGSTKAEASEWIGEHIGEYKLETADSWALDHGYF